MQDLALCLPEAAAARHLMRYRGCQLSQKRRLYLLFQGRRVARCLCQGCLRLLCKSCLLLCCGIIGIQPKAPRINRLHTSTIQTSVDRLQPSLPASQSNPSLSVYVAPGTLCRAQ